MSLLSKKGRWGQWGVTRTTTYQAGVVDRFGKSVYIVEVETAFRYTGSRKRISLAQHPCSGRQGIILYFRKIMSYDDVCIDCTIELNEELDRQGVADLLHPYAVRCFQVYSEEMGNPIQNPIPWKGEYGFDVSKVAAEDLCDGHFTDDLEHNAGIVLSVIESYISTVSVTQGKTTITLTNPDPDEGVSYERIKSIAQYLFSKSTMPYASIEYHVDTGSDAWTNQWFMIRSKGTIRYLLSYDVADELSDLIG